MKKTKKIPEFKNEDEERKFRATRDSTEYVDWKKAKRVVLPKLKPSVKRS
ncbi:MAG: CopG family antitoxin [Thermodesulfobacteriota bacterium]